MPQDDAPRESYTVNGFATRLGVGPEKVRAWIECKQLRALNIATDERSRPRYRILLADAEDFERRRATLNVSAKRKRRSSERPAIEPVIS